MSGNRIKSRRRTPPELRPTLPDTDRYQAELLKIVALKTASGRVIHAVIEHVTRLHRSEQDGEIRGRGQGEGGGGVVVARVPVSLIEVAEVTDEFHLQRRSEEPPHDGDSATR